MKSSSRRPVTHDHDNNGVSVIFNYPVNSHLSPEDVYQEIEKYFRDFVNTAKFAKDMQLSYARTFVYTNPNSGQPTQAGKESKG